MSWMIAILVFGLGVAAGMLLTYLTSEGSRKNRQLRQQLDEVNRAYDGYRQEVSDHFARTAVAVNQLTENYRAVHDQLRDGAQRLCDDAAAEHALAFDQSKLIGPAPDPAAAAGGDRQPVQAPASGSGDGTGLSVPRDESPAPAVTVTESSVEPQLDTLPPAPPRDYVEEGSGEARKAPTTH